MHKTFLTVVLIVCCSNPVHVSRNSEYCYVSFIPAKGMCFQGDSALFQNAGHVIERLPAKQEIYCWIAPCSSGAAHDDSLWVTKDTVWILK